MGFLDKVYVPLNSLLVALISVAVISSDKVVLINNIHVSPAIILFNFIVFIISFVSLFFSENDINRMIKTVFGCVLFNIILIFVLINTSTPTDVLSIGLQKSYMAIYRPFKFIIIVSLMVFYYLFSIFPSKYVQSRFVCASLVASLILLFGLHGTNLEVFANYSIPVYISEIIFFSVVLILVEYLKNNFMSVNSKNSISKIPGYYLIITMLCVTLLINSHSVCYKFVNLPFYGVVSASGIMFPFTFLLADVVAEHYGYAASRMLIWSTLLAQFVFVVLLYIIYLMPEEPNWINSISFANIFSNLLPRQLLAASMCVFFSFFVFSFLISVVKTNLQRKRFWQRTLFANVIAKAILCFFSYTILYYGKYDFAFIWSVIWHTWVLKMFIATVGTFVITIPFIYYLKIYDQRVYPYQINYTPFKLSFSFTSKSY